LTRRAFRPSPAPGHQIPRFFCNWDGPDPDHEPRRLAAALFQGRRAGGLGLLRDLHDLWLLAQEALITWEVPHQAALALRDPELVRACAHATVRADRRIAWLRTRIDQAAPQALIVPS
jgi:hypothetical protein